MKKLLTSAKPFSFDVVVLFYRVAVSVSLFFVHGLKKAGEIGEGANEFPDPLGLGSKVTFVIAFVFTIICPLLIAAGFLTRVAALGVLSLTLSGLLLVHIHDPLAVMDTPYIYSVSALMIILCGPGKYSVDAWLDLRRPVPTNLTTTL